MLSARIHLVFICLNLECNLLLSKSGTCLQMCFSFWYYPVWITLLTILHAFCACEIAMKREYRFIVVHGFIAMPVVMAA